MRIPAMAAVIERRLLINYRVDAEVARGMVPAPLRPRLVRGSAVAGICLIRLGELRPVGLPAMLGMRTENGAVRIAVEWDAGPGEAPHLGVYIPRRYSSSASTVVLGGRLFPGMHDAARFAVEESADTVSVGMAARSGCARLAVRLSIAGAWPGSGLFADLAEASAFFRDGAAGYSATRDPNRLDGLELRTPAWQVEPGVLSRASSSFFDDPDAFPPGTAEPDTPLVMRNVPVTWHNLPSLRTSPAARPPQPLPA